LKYHYHPNKTTTTFLITTNNIIITTTNSGFRGGGTGCGLFKAANAKFPYLFARSAGDS